MISIRGAYGDVDPRRGTLGSGHRPLRRRLAGFIAFVIFLAGAASVTAIDHGRLLNFLTRSFGAEKAQVFEDWRRMIEASRNFGTPDQLRRVNEFFNRRLQFADDQQVWGQSDYWATPMETLGKGQGDCEDFTIAKYFTLLSLGVPNEKLRLIYAKAVIGGPGSTILQAHMVLAYYPAPDAEPMILDNLITEIRPASRRSDLLPIFSFNSAGIWAGPGAGDAQGGGGTGRLSRWQDLLQRARAEGFD